MKTYLLYTALAKLEAIVKDGYYDELIELVKTDDNFRKSLLKIESLVNWNYAHTTRSFNKEFLFSLKANELDALIRAFTALDGAADQFTFGGSTPVQCLFHRLDDFSYDKKEELLDWIFRNRKNNNILPFGWDPKRNVKSLFEYILVDQAQEAKGYAERQQNNLRSIQKRIDNKPKNTDNLKDAIRRKDLNSFDGLIRQGADINELDDDGKTLSEKIEEVKREVIKSGKIYRSELEESIYLTDKNEKALRITIGDLTLNADELNKFHYVTIASNYDNEFGFSNLHRFEEYVFKMVSHLLLLLL